MVNNAGGTNSCRACERMPASGLCRQRWHISEEDTPGVRRPDSTTRAPSSADCMEGESMTSSVFVRQLAEKEGSQIHTGIRLNDAVVVCCSHLRLASDRGESRDHGSPLWFPLCRLLWRRRMSCSPSERVVSALRAIRKARMLVPNVGTTARRTTSAKGQRTTTTCVAGGNGFSSSSAALLAWSPRVVPVLMGSGSPPAHMTARSRCGTCHVG
jgi:hypothetical protein